LRRIETGQVVRVGIPLVHGTNLYPMVKSQSTEIKQLKTIQTDGVEVWSITFTDLDFTYVETVRHISSHGPLPSEVFARRPAHDIYRAVIAHVDVGRGEEISLSDLKESLGEVRRGDALIVHANSYTDKWLAKSHGIIDVNDFNLESPYFSGQAMKAIIDAGTVMLGGDFPSFSNPRTEKGFGIEMISEFYGREGNMILAPMITLREIRQTVVALQVNPLEIAGVCALPCNPTVYQGQLGQAFLEYLTRASSKVR